MKTIIGIDNGPSGTIASCGMFGLFVASPVIKIQDYTKKKKIISRLDAFEFTRIMALLKGAQMHHEVMIYIERPMVNPTRFNASMVAVRFMEAQLAIIESYRMAYQFVDSKEWQREMLPNGVEKEQLKQASMDVACRLFPQHQEAIRKHGDGDSLLMAEWARRKYWVGQ